MPYSHYLVGKACQEQTLKLNGPIHKLFEYVPNFNFKIKQGTLTKGEGSVLLTYLYNKFKSAAFDIGNIVYFFTKQTILQLSS